MPNLDPAQQPSGNPTTPSANENDATQLRAALEAANKELEKTTRSYNGLDGNFKTVKEERDTLKAQLDELKKTMDQERSGIITERDTYKTQAETVNQSLAQLQGTHATVTKKAEALEILVSEFPDLVPAYSNKMIRLDGLEGDDLKNYLNHWKESATKLNLALNHNVNSGTSVPPPNQEMASVTLDEAVDNKLSALRKGGPTSPEYLKWAKIEDELIKQRKK